MADLNVIHVATIKDAVIYNEVFEILGRGPNNLSVLLIDKNGKKYLGCHDASWCTDEFKDFKERKGFKQILTQKQIQVLDRIYESVMPHSGNYVATDHFNMRLEEWGLTKVESEI